MSTLTKVVLAIAVLAGLAAIVMPVEYGYDGRVVSAVNQLVAASISASAFCFFLIRVVMHDEL